MNEIMCSYCLLESFYVSSYLEYIEPKCSEFKVYVRSVILPIIIWREKKQVIIPIYGLDNVSNIQKSILT